MIVQQLQRQVSSHENNNDLVKLMCELLLYLMRQRLCFLHYRLDTVNSIARFIQRWIFKKKLPIDKMPKLTNLNP